MNLHSQAWGVIQQTLKQVPSGCADGSLPRLRRLTWLWLSGTCILRLPANPTFRCPSSDVRAGIWLGIERLPFYIIFVKFYVDGNWNSIKNVPGEGHLYLYWCNYLRVLVFGFFFLPVEITLGIKGSIIWVNELVEFPLLRSHLPTPSF